MDIRLINTVIRRPAAKVLAIAIATAVSTFSGEMARGQSGLEGFASAGDRPAAATFGPGTKIVSASAVRTAADVSTANRLAPGSISRAIGTTTGKPGTAEPGTIAQVNFGCQSCSQPACNGTCNGGLHGGHGGQYGGSMACGIPCDPYYYVIAEAMYMEREGDGGYSLTRNERMDDFGFEWVPRITIGTLPNCVNGYEFTFIGPTEWNRNSTVVDTNAVGNIDSNLFDGDGPGGFDGTFLDPFENANLQTQFYNNKYWSGEFNRTLVGWNVAKALCGARVIRIEEDFGYASEKDIFTSYADLTSSTINTLVGLQAGLDLLYPVTRHLYTDVRGRGGVYYNFAESDIRLRNQGVTVLSSSRDDEEFAGVFELGVGLRFELGSILSVRAGGDFTYITNVATVPGQIDPNVTNGLGRNVDINDGLLYYGASVGAELRF